jgi:hypothetical protein
MTFSPVPDLPERASVLEARYKRRLPDSLDDLAGPATGTVQLPLHVAWSGLTRFELTSSRPCMTLYRIVLAEGQRADILLYLNRDLLLGQWPVLRTLVGRHISKVWESAFPELRLL